MDVYHDYVISQLNELEDMYDGSGKVFCEIGCGTGYLADSLIENGWFFIGVDFSMDQLRFLEERLRAKQLGNYLLIRADIRNVPIRSGVVDLVCGLGVIEHVKSSETLTVLQNLYRILKNGGNSFNSVPVFNPGNLIYRSQWGGIPNIPIFKQLAEFVHIKILKEKHMRFGYELQFTPSQMRKLHIEAGFDRESIKIGRFRHKIILRAIRNGKIRDYLVKLCETNRLFWPMIKISATKTKP